MNPNPHVPPPNPFSLSWTHITDWWGYQSTEFQKEFPLYDNANGPLKMQNIDVLLEYNKTYYPKYCDVKGNFIYSKWTDTHPDEAEKMFPKAKPKLAPEIKRFINRV